MNNDAVLEICRQRLCKMPVSVRASRFVDRIILEKNRGLVPFIRLPSSVSSVACHDRTSLTKIRHILLIMMKYSVWVRKIRSTVVFQQCVTNVAVSVIEAAFQLFATEQDPDGRIQ